MKTELRRVGDVVTLARFDIPWPPDYYPGDYLPMVTGCLQPNGELIAVCVEDIPDAFRFQIRMRRFDLSGEPLGSPVPIGTNSVASHSPVIGSSNFGRFLVAWNQGYTQLWAQVFAPDGSRIGSELKVSERGIRPQIAAHEDGRFVIVWQESERGLCRVLAPDGNFLSSAFPVCDVSPTWTHAVWEATNSILIIWTERNEITSTSRVMGRRFDATGQPLCEPFSFNPEYPVFTDNVGAATRLDDERLAIVGQSELGLVARTFTAQGDPADLPWHVVSPFEDVSDPYSVASIRSQANVITIMRAAKTGLFNLRGPRVQSFAPDGFPLTRALNLSQSSNQTVLSVSLGTGYGHQTVALWGAYDPTGYGLFAQRFEMVNTDLPPNPGGRKSLVTNEILANLFRLALQPKERSEPFGWHDYAESPRSSQALCLSAFGSLRASELDANRNQLTADFVSKAFPLMKTKKRPRRWDIYVEVEIPELLNELGRGQPTSIDAIFESSQEVITVESKFVTDAKHGFGPCGQYHCSQKEHTGKVEKTRKCAGFYGPASDLAGESNAWCRLERWDGLRAPRLYWTLGREFFRQEVFRLQIQGETCPFRDGNFQLMRNFLFAAAMARKCGKQDFGALIVCPKQHETTLVSQLKVFRDEILLPEHAGRVHLLHYETWIELLRKTSLSIAGELANFLENRINSVKP